MKRARDVVITARSNARLPYTIFKLIVFVLRSGWIIFRLDAVMITTSITAEFFFDILMFIRLRDNKRWSFVARRYYVNCHCIWEAINYQMPVDRIKGIRSNEMMNELPVSIDEKKRNDSSFTWSTMTHANWIHLPFYPYFRCVALDFSSPNNTFDGNSQRRAAKQGYRYRNKSHVTRVNSFWFTITQMNVYFGTIHNTAHKFR